MSESSDKPERGIPVRSRLALVLLVVGLLCVVGAVLAYTRPWDRGTAEEDVDWTLTLIGSIGEQRLLDLDEIKAMPSCQGQGGYFTTAGAVFGPYSVKGVSLEALCDLVGGVGPTDIVFVSAADGYSSVFDCDQFAGEIPTYDPVNIREVPNEGVQLILIYEQDGQPLSHEDGKPVRVAVTGGSDLLTEGFYWVKWVNKIEIITPA